MKTTDLIPLILYQLVDGDKYGYEIVKQIEDCSNGKITIKQPTLYSLLKKLEQGKFISSYWQDSEIGGKRHYYKLTENGKAQLDTYPPLNELVLNSSYENNIEPNKPDNLEVVKEQPSSQDLNIEKDSNVKIEQETAQFNQFDDTPPIITPINLVSNAEITTFNYSNTPDEQEEADKINSPGSTVEVNIFDAMETSNDNFDYSKYKTLNDELDKKDSKEKTQLNELVENKNDENATFTKKIEPIKVKKADNKLYSKLSPNENLIVKDEDISPYSPSIIDDVEKIKYINYIDFSTDKNTIKRRKAINKHIIKCILTCSSMLIMLIISIILGFKFGFSKIYYLTAIIFSLIFIFYPLLLIRNLTNLRLKYSTKQFYYSISKDFFIKLSLFLTVVILIFAYNLNQVVNISSIFKITNFANFYAPLIFSFAIILDFIYSAICYKEYRK